MLQNKYNIKRSNTISGLKRKNNKLIKQLNREQKNMIIQKENLHYIEKLKNKLQKCSVLSLYSYSFEQGWKYISSHTCDSKFCFICNWNRQKAIRRKLLKWFQDNKIIFEIQPEGKTKYCTETQYKNKFKSEKIINKHKFDVFHLVLTVPHFKELGFNGNKYYFREIAEKYDLLRKKPFFKENIFGGEYGIETTNTENGLNIHIHSLLLVKKFTQNRNVLHKEILLQWNKLTVNENSVEIEIDETRAKNIIKGNKLLTTDDVKLLSPKGATLITFESIYQEGPNGKDRNFEYGSNEMIKSILEVVKYHFEPQCFDKDKKEFDLQMMIELSPVLHRMQLYKKIGIWHGETALNLAYKDKTEEFTEVIETIDQETGEIPETYREFFIFNPAYIFHSPEQIFPSKAAKLYGKKISAHTTRQAMDLLSENIKAMEKAGTKPQNHHLNKSFIN